MARQGEPALREKSAAEESLGSERGRPAVRWLAAMKEGGRARSEFWGRRRPGNLAWRFEKRGMTRLV